MDNSAATHEGMNEHYVKKNARTKDATESWRSAINEI